MYKDKKVIHLVTRGLNGEIGKDNKLLWCIKEELQYFRECTLGHVLLMGRKTYESLPKKLDRRIVVKCTRRWEGMPDEINLEDKLLCCEDYSIDLNTDTIFVCGGSQLYKATEDIADELWITEVHREYPEADTYYNQPDGYELYSQVEGKLCLDKISGNFIWITYTKWKRKEV